MTEFQLTERKTFTYERPAIDRGYTGQTLAVDLAGETITTRPVSGDMKRIFIGGQGV